MTESELSLTLGDLRHAMLPRFLDRGMSIEQLADALRLPISVVEAVRDGEYDLPDDTPLSELGHRR